MSNKIWVIAKGEFRRYFFSPLAYVYMVCFLLLNGAVSLYFGGVFTQGNASLRPMFDFLPWIYLLFVTGIAMRLWAEEFKSGTILQIVTMPVKIADFVWGKFLAAWAFCLLALLLTLSFVVTLNVLGQPDNGVIFNSYFGAFLLAGAMLAVSQTASALTKNQVIALVLAVLFNLLFLFSGLEFVLGAVRKVAPDFVVHMVASFSFLTHMTSFSFGKMDFASVVFFVSLIFVFNFITQIIINLRTVGTSPWLKKASLSGYLVVVLLVFAIFVGVNLFAGGVLRKYKIDFTEEKLFTLSSSTKKVLQELPAKVTVKVFYSPILGERDENMRIAYEKLKMLLEEYKTEAKEKFDYAVYNPEPLSDIEDRAINLGLQPLAVSDLNFSAYFGVVAVNENGKSKTIPFLPLEKSNFVEKELTETIFALEAEQKTVGVFSSLPVLGGYYNGMFKEPWQIANEITKFYSLRNVLEPKDLSDLDILMIVHPEKMTKEMEEAIYKYSVEGGKVLAFFDTASEAKLLLAPQKELLKTSDYGDLPKKWGLKFYGDKVVADMGNSTQVEVVAADYSSVSQDLIQFYITEDGFFADLPETKNLKRILTTSVSVFTPEKDALVYFVPLMTASKESQILSSDVVVKNIHPADILRQFTADKQNKVLAAHVISQNEKEPFEVIVVGDSDLLYDSFWTSSLIVGDKHYNVPLLDNGNFVLNALDVLSGKDVLIDLRGKSPKKRPFKKVEQKQKEVLREFKVKEKDVFDQIEHIKKGLEEIWNKKDFEKRQNFTPEELSIISKIKKELTKKRKELFEIRKELIGITKNTEQWVKFFNIYAIPLFIVVVFGLMKVKKVRKVSFCKPLFNKKAVWLVSAAVFSLILGCVGVMVQPEVNQRNVEGKPLFEKLPEKINKVEKIKFENSKKQLVFRKNNGIWELEGREGFFVDQRRMKSFLTALMQATIYEKKADKVENLARFGLLPLGNKDSRAIVVELGEANGQIIEKFEVGDYNIELGRGAMGAFVRRPDKFEIWIAIVELIDLDLDYHKWVFANMWNLQFGRFMPERDDKNVEKAINLAKLLLNTQMEEEKENILHRKPDFVIKTKGEFFDGVNIEVFEEKDRALVSFKFLGNIKNEILKSFVGKTKGKFFAISKQDAERLKDANK